MQHMVIYRAAEGKPSYQPADDLDSALKFVEHLRNDQEIGDAHVFRLEEVPVELKAYYRAEVAGADPGDPAERPGHGGLPGHPGDGGEVGEMTGPTPVAVGGGRFGLFGR